MLRLAGGAAAVASVRTGATDGSVAPQRCLAVGDANEVVGEGDFADTSEGIFFCTLTPEHSHVLIPSAVVPGAVTGPYSITVHSTHQVKMLEFPEVQAAVLHGQWSKEGGGCSLHVTWSSNPKFLIIVSEPGVFTVTLSVDGGQWKRGKSLDKMIGFCVFPCKADGKIIPDRKAILHETPYLPMKEVRLDLPLTAELGLSYVIMPTLHAPDLAGKFDLSVTSETPFKFSAV